MRSSESYTMRFLAIFIFLLFFLSSLFIQISELTAREPDIQWKLTKTEKIIEQNLHDYFQKHQYQEALNYLVAQQNKINNLLFYHRQYLEILFLQEKKQKLLNLATQWITKYKNNPNYLFLRAMFLYRLQHRLSAYDDFVAAYKNNNQTSKIVEFLYYYYITIQYSNLPSTSYELIEQILQIKPDNSYFWVEKTKLQIRAKNFQAAYNSIQTAISLAPNKEYYTYLLELEKIIDPHKYQNTLVYLLEQYPQDINYYKQYFALQKTIAAQQIFELDLIKFLADKKDESYLADFYLLLANIQQKLGKKEAIANYKKAISLQASPTTIIILAKILWNAGKKEQAIVYFRELYDKQEQEAWIFYALGTYYKEQNQPYSAEEFILSGLEYHPDNTTLLWLYAQVLQTQGRYQEAIIAAKEILKREKNHHFFLSNIGYWYSLLNNYKLAEKFLKQALAIQNNELTRYRIANVYYRQNNEDLALSYLKEEFKNYELLPFVYELKAEIHFTKKHYTASLSNLQKSINFFQKQGKEPTNFIKNLEIKNLLLLENFDLARAKIQSYAKQTKFMQRQQILLKFNNQKTTKDELVNEITNYLQQNEIDNFLLEIFFYLTQGKDYLWDWNAKEAKVYQKILLLQLQDAKSILTKLPESSNKIFLNYFLAQAQGQNNSLLGAHASGFWQQYYLGYESFRNAEVAKSIIFAKNAILENKNFIWSHVLLGRIYQKQKNYKKAIQSYKKFLTRFPLNLSVLRMLAVSYDLQQQPQQAEKIYLKLIDQYPNEELAFNNLAWLYLTKIKSTKNTEKALKLSQKAVAINASSANLDTLAEAYYQNGNYKQALKLIEKSLVLDTQDLDHFKQQKDKFLKALQTRVLVP